MNRSEFLAIMGGLIAAAHAAPTREQSVRYRFPADPGGPDVFIPYAVYQERGGYPAPLLSRVKAETLCTIAYGRRMCIEWQVARLTPEFGRDQVVMLDLRNRLEPTIDGVVPDWLRIELHSFRPLYGGAPPISDNAPRVLEWVA